jgi:hypothetical protein
MHAVVWIWGMLKNKTDHVWAKLKTISDSSSPGEYAQPVVYWSNCVSVCICLSLVEGME